MTPGFLSELKRRRVLRVAAVYGATAFVVLQGIDLVFPRLGLPDWTVTLAVALALAGLPLALGLAWAFEATPDGVRRTPAAAPGELERIAAAPRVRRWAAASAAVVGLLLLGGGAAWNLGMAGERARPYESIAVLPFENRSGVAADEYFGDGLAEELLNALGRIDGLKVAARTSSFAFKNTSVDVRTIGDTLGVMTVLEGSVRRLDDRIRITARLVDARSGYQLWSESYDRPLTELFSVQDAIAAEIVHALRIRLRGAGEELYRGGTRDVAAYDLYLLGRQKWATRQVPLLEEAITHFEEAIRRDSSFALAWSGFADAIDALAWRTPDAFDRVPEGRRAAQFAIALDPELGEAWASLGVLESDFSHDWPLAEAALRRAIRLSPSYSSAYLWLSDVLRWSDRREASLEPARLAFLLDPLPGLGMHAYARSLVIVGRYAEAADLYMRLRSSGRNVSGELLDLVSNARLFEFDPADTEQYAREWAASTGYARAEEAGVIGRAMHDAALRPLAARVLHDMDAAGVSLRELAELDVVLGDHDAAFDRLRRVPTSNRTLINVLGDPMFDPLRADPRFALIRDQILVAR